MTSKQSQLNKLDYPMLTIVGLLLVFGLVMLYSASTVISYQNFGNTSYYFFPQLYGAGLGLLALIFCLKFNYKNWLKLVPFLLVGSLIALCLVKIPGIGFSSGGATRWVQIGPIFFQPSEIAKLAIIIYTASWLSKTNVGKGFFKEFFPPIFIVGMVSLLILWQPDLGSVLALSGTAFIMLYAGGAKIKYLAWSAAAAIVSLLALIKIEPYRLRRITTFLNPEIDPTGISYQINQALLAIGGGGLWGYGYGLSRQKYNYLPEAIGDSMFAVMAEELGFLRMLLLLALFLAFALRGIKIAERVKDPFGRMLAIGIVASIVLQSFINIGAIIGLLPLTGITLPFFSYGSSSLIITLAEIGILLNIARQST
jgi:cell division protein FtsW